ncbi:hypothetical protein EV426DRAFT_707744 [Tirmania nivea]|nr:hypothetical protein EV426DRAFT_707744 [Tirmania nivea]
MPPTATTHRKTYHITFDCLQHRQQHQKLIGNARTWEEVDTPVWRREEREEEEWDAVEAYFAYLYRPLARRYHTVAKPSANTQAVIKTLPPDSNINQASTTPKETTTDTGAPASTSTTSRPPKDPAHADTPDTSIPSNTDETTSSNPRISQTQTPPTQARAVVLYEAPVKYKPNLMLR